MRKLLLALFALALVVAFTAPSHAADFKMTGLYQVRGTSNNANKDGDDEMDDKDNYLEALIRPRFTAKSGAVTYVWEPEFRSAHGGFGGSVTYNHEHVHGTSTDKALDKATHADGTAGRQTVGVNRWAIDFAIPGSALRMRWGRWDRFSPDKEIYDSGGRTREPGVGVYGKLSKNMSLSMFYVKNNEDKSAANADKEDYYVGVGIKVSPTLTLSPWVANSRNGAADGYDYSFFGLHAKGKMGILSLNASVVGQDGELDGGKDLSGWAVLVRTSASLGKLKLSGNLTMLSGDDGSNAGETGKFHFPQNNGSGWLHGSHIVSSRRWDSINNDLKDVTLKNLNGATVLEGLAEYKVSKTFSLGGGVSLYNSAESAPGADMNTSKEFGTELNAGFKWVIHPRLEFRAVGAVILRGDYGRAANATEPDDGWVVSWRLRGSF